MRKSFCLIESCKSHDSLVFLLRVVPRLAHISKKVGFLRDSLKILIFLKNFKISSNLVKTPPFSPDFISTFEINYFPGISQKVEKYCAPFSPPIFLI